MVPNVRAMRFRPTEAHPKPPCGTLFGPPFGPARRTNPIDPVTSAQEFAEKIFPQSGCVPSRSVNP
jgi:hypothetical protein